MSAIFPTSEHDVTAALLTEILAVRHAGTMVDRVEVVAVKRCGEGIASTADRMTLVLDYGDNPGGLPAQMLCKTMLASPRAPAEMFETEVRFYDEIRPTLDIETPKCFGTGFEPASGQFGLLLEDLSLRGARFPDTTQAVAVDEVAALLSQLARLHARFWRSPRFAADLSWVATPFVGGMAPLLDDIGHALIADQLARHPFKVDLLAPLGLGFDELWSVLQRSRAVLAAAPVTLLHGDTHLGNTYLLPDGGGLLDWQLQVRGCWAHDVVYLLSTALPPEVRRRHGPALVAGYVDELARMGVADAPAADEAWEWCRRAVIWGLVIGWLICPPANYGMDITTANIERMVAAVADLDAVAAVEAGPPI
ncbi:MAG: phosphotransferase [Actinomycetota bacterium]|nr:phosphotransferase [Actinomycetota bacterium]